MEIQISSDFMLKILEAYFEKISEIKGWVRTGIWWTINSKFRTTKSIDKFLKDQLQNPSDNLVVIANSLKANTHDETMNNILKFVNETIKYETDNMNYGMDEYWASAD